MNQPILQNPGYLVREAGRSHLKQPNDSIDDRIEFFKPTLMRVAKAFPFHPVLSWAPNIATFSPSKNILPFISLHSLT